MQELVPILTEEEIEKTIIRIAQSISLDYKDRDLILIGVLKGSFIFLSDLIRELSIPVKIDFIQVSSYGNGTSPSGSIKLKNDVGIEIKGKDIIVIEDIVDTGFTLEYVINHLNNSEPASIKVCTLIDKLERRKTDIKIDYSGHITREGFLVGYGLDYAENFRNLPGIFHLKL
jgi:hypoxanthine phosphoribosyltransferase